MEKTRYCENAILPKYKFSVILKGAPTGFFFVCENRHINSKIDMKEPKVKNSHEFTREEQQYKMICPSRYQGSEHCKAQG